MKGKKKKKNTNEGFNVDSEILKTVRNILDFLEQIFIKLHPLLRKTLLMEEAEEIHTNGTLRDLVQLLDNISREYKRLSFHINTKN
ncbi:hypothetical protein LCGC14_0765800 [marine sediment metagenome]|uniref:Uncharacterized protein n=1 Tax=marine sediment metagenome TaxID=412755 RepID=A0A0F9T6T5_9ZZZZ